MTKSELLQMLKKYEVVGTIEECRKAREKQIPKEVVDDTEFGMCPHCHNEFNSELVNEYNVKYCLYCGQALSWKGMVEHENNS